MFTKIGSFLGTLAFVACVALGVHMNVEANSYKPPPTLASLQASVVKIETLDSICSGWVLAGSNKVVTAAHCFEDSATNGPIMAMITFNDGATTVYQVTKMGDPTTATMDFAELAPAEPLKHTMPVGLPVCKFKPYYGEEIYAMGNPLGADRVISFGHVSNPNVQQDKASPEAILNGGMFVDITIFQGSSGGPIIDSSTGCVMGSVELMIPVHVGEVAIPVGINYASPIPNGL